MLNKAKISSEEESSSHGRGHHRGRGRGRRRVRGRGCNQLVEEDNDKKLFNKSVIQCYNCQKYIHFA